MRVKICGLTHPEDALEAARAGSDYIGMIFHKGSKRNVSLSLAKEIVSCAREGGAEPVGVFVEQDEEQISAICQEIDIGTVQLHGKRAKNALSVLLGRYFLIYALSPIETDLSGLPPSVLPLFDHGRGGEGIAFDWINFSPPEKREWILAGGLSPTNLAEAIMKLNPTCVDVATGVELKGTMRKDIRVVKEFIAIAKGTR